MENKKTRGKTKRYSINYDYIYNVLGVERPKERKFKVIEVNQWGGEKLTTSEEKC